VNFSPVVFETKYSARTRRIPSRCRGVKCEYTVQSPAELKVDREFYLTSVAGSSALHSTFRRCDARSAIGISRQMRRRHTRPRQEHPDSGSE